MSTPFAETSIVTNSKHGENERCVIRELVADEVGMVAGGPETENEPEPT